MKCEWFAKDWWMFLVSLFSSLNQKTVESHFFFFLKKGFQTEALGSVCAKNSYILECVRANGNSLRNACIYDLWLSHLC